MTTHQAFRALFPALSDQAWFDTPGAPPAPQPVAAALSHAVHSWQLGNFDWLSWDAIPQHVRTLIAGHHGVAEHRVALMNSVSEAAATVAAVSRRGATVVLDDEYRSVLFPFLDRHNVQRVSRGTGGDRTARLLGAIHSGVSLVAFSEILSSDGDRVDVAAVCAAAHSVGARVFVDATQSCGVLATDLDRAGADYVAVHGYKWMLCPRGVAWLIVADDAVGELKPLAPGWKSTALPHGYFGGLAQYSAGAAKLDASPAWLSWIGAQAALEVMASLDRRDVERHSTTLADEMRCAAAEQGFAVRDSALRSHIVVLEFDDLPDLARLLEKANIKASATSNRLRLGYHYFNNRDDNQRLLAVLSTARKSKLRAAES